jgi:hypothetical protein
VLTAGEQRELSEIEEGLRDRAFASRLTALQGVLRWAAPGRQRYLLVLAAVAAALLRFVAATGRLLIAAGWGALALEPSALTVLGDVAWPGLSGGEENPPCCR